MPSENVRDMSDDELFVEYRKWNDKIIKSAFWGAALAAAAAFRRDCALEIRLRGLGLPD